MPAQPRPNLRHASAALAIACGAGHLASQWLRALDRAALASLMQGTVYLFIALGLAGRGKLSLYLGVAAPLAAAALRLHYTTGELSAGTALALLTDALLTALCATVLWRRRGEETA